MYDEVSVLAHEAGLELMERLRWMTLSPKVIVDMGCGTGVMSKMLHERYPHAQMIALDSSPAMLGYMKNKHTEIKNFIGADANQLPLRNQSVDLICANLLLPWCASGLGILAEWRRVLREDGLLMFSALGLDTLKEWREFLSHEQMPTLYDMHDIGDKLLQQGFADPVVDVNDYTLTYSSKQKCAEELYHSGMITIPAEKFAANQALPADDHTWHVTYEVITGHAFAPALKEKDAANEIRVPLSQLRRQRE